MQRFMQFFLDNPWFFLIPIAFIALVAWVFRPSARKRYEEDAEIPFADKDDK